MANLSYCLDCQRVFKSNDKCEYCNSTKVKQLKKGTSVNVIGSKQKGQVFKIGSEKVTLLIVNEMNEKLIHDYKVDELKKIL